MIRNQSSCIPCLAVQFILCMATHPKEENRKENQFCGQTVCRKNLWVLQSLLTYWVSDPGTCPPHFLGFSIICRMEQLRKWDLLQQAGLGFLQVTPVQRSQPHQPLHPESPSFLAVIKFAVKQCEAPSATSAAITCDETGVNPAQTAGNGLSRAWFRAVRYS